MVPDIVGGSYLFFGISDMEVDLPRETKFSIFGLMISFDRELGRVVGELSEILTVLVFL